jgi:hypothetical protein
MRKSSDGRHSIAWMTLARDGDFDNLEKRGHSSHLQPKARPLDLESPRGSHADHRAPEERPREEEDNQGTLESRARSNPWSTYGASDRLIEQDAAAYQERSDIADDEAVPGAESVAAEDDER